jgi:hypothetical protein
MPHGVKEHPEQKAERLEREAHIAIGNFHLKEAGTLLNEALAIRETVQGENHPDIIWTLSLMIEALRWDYSRENVWEAALVGERRLALRRVALAGAPDELACSFRELIWLYTFEYTVMDQHRVYELRRELNTLLEAEGRA